MVLEIEFSGWRVFVQQLQPVAVQLVDVFHRLTAQLGDKSQQNQQRHRAEPDPRQPVAAHRHKCRDHHHKACNGQRQHPPPFLFGFALQPVALLFIRRHTHPSFWVISPCATSNARPLVRRRSGAGSQQVIITCHPSIWFKI